MRKNVDQGTPVCVLLPISKVVFRMRWSAPNSSNLGIFSVQAYRSITLSDPDANVPVRCSLVGLTSEPLILRISER